MMIGRATVGVGLLFASNGVVFASLLPWYPLITERLGLDATQFGFIVASFAVGAMASSVLPSRLIARFGPLRVSFVGTVVLAGALEAAVWAGNGWVLAAALFLAGFADAIVDVAQNVVGVRVQEAASRSILSSMHALWSLGGVAGGVLSTAAAATGVDARIHMAVVVLGGVVLVGTGMGMIGRLEEERHSGDPSRNPGGSPEDRPRRGAWAIALVLVVVAVCGTTVEDVANNWAAMSGVQLAGLPPAIAGAAFAVVIGSQCLGRFTGDLLINRLGRCRVARLGGVLIAAGGLLVVTATGPVQLFLGLAVVGYGSATLVPSAISAAARIPGFSEGTGVTLVSWLMRIGFLATSPIVGSVADRVGLRWGLVVLPVAGIVTVALAGVLNRGGTKNVRNDSRETGGMA